MAIEDAPANRASKARMKSTSMTTRCQPSFRKFRRAIAFRATIPLLIMATVSCGRVSKTFSFEKRIGWLHGPCLAIANPNLTSGTPVALVIMGEPQRVQQAQIEEQTNSPASCPALLEGRRTQNAQPGTSFYGLKTVNLSSTDMG